MALRLLALIPLVAICLVLSFLPATARPLPEIGEFATLRVPHGEGRVMLRQPDGRFVLAGPAHVASRGSVGSNGLAVARFHPDGSPDFSFGGVGYSIEQWQPKEQTIWVHAAVLQSDGRIVVGGWLLSAPHSRDRDLMLARFNPDGSFDTSFGTLGYTILPLSTMDDEIHAMALLPGDALLVVGSSDGESLIARFDADGALDPTFGSAGIVLHDLFAGVDERLVSLVRDASGTLHVAGDYCCESSSNRRYLFLARFDADGALDTAFGSAGVVDTGRVAGVSPLARDATGRLYTSLYIPYTTLHDTTSIVRYLPDGTLDTTFANQGELVLRLLRDHALVRALAIDAQQRLVVAGEIAVVEQSFPSDPPDEIDFFTARILPNGTLDPNYWMVGWTLRRIPRTADPSFLFDWHARPAAVMADGDAIYVGGTGFRRLPGFGETITNMLFARVAGGLEIRAPILLR